MLHLTRSATDSARSDEFAASVMLTAIARETCTTVGRRATTCYERENRIEAADVTEQGNKQAGQRRRTNREDACSLGGKVHGSDGDGHGEGILQPVRAGLGAEWRLAYSECCVARLQRNDV
jgi:hypothetical protein